MDDLEFIGRIANRGSTPLAASDGLPVTLPAPGEIIGKLRIESVLGHGGIGVVYRAIDPASEVRRAIKIPYPENTQRDIDRFRVEAKICAHLEHPNIVKVYNVDFYCGVLPYAEMDFVDGPSVLEHIKERPLPAPVALSIVILLCRALEYAYAQTFTIDGASYERMVHRDIKPGNILISGKGVVKLADFGLAKFEGVDLHTIAGAMPGTVPYMAPEQHQSPVASVRTDIYSLGVTLYEMVTGKRPFPEKGAEAFAQLIAAKIDGRYAPPGSLDKTLHPGIDAIVRRCLQPDDGKRYPSYAALRMAVESVLADYADLDAEDLVGLYYANRKNYRLAVADRFARRLRMPKSVKFAAITFTVAVTALAILYSAAHRKRPDGPGTNAAKVTVMPRKAVGDTPPRQAEVDGKKSVVAAAHTPAPDAPAGISKKGNNAAGSMKNALSGPSGKAAAPMRASPLSEGVAAWRAGRFAEAARFLRAVAVDTLLAVERDSAALIVLDSYYRAGAVNEALVYGSDNAVNDGTYHLLMALLYDAAEMRREAEAAFARSLAAPCRFDPSIAGKRYFYRAKFYQKVFDGGRSQSEREAMLQAWRDFLRNGCAQRSAECDDARRIVGTVREN